MTTKTFDVTDVRRLEPQAGTAALALGGITVGGRAGGVGAIVTTTAGDGVELRLGVSRLEGETEWIVDSFSANGVPRFVNGVGARCTALKSVKDDAIVAALDAAAEGVTA